MVLKTSTCQILMTSLQLRKTPGSSNRRERGQTKILEVLLDLIAPLRQMSLRMLTVDLVNVLMVLILRENLSAAIEVLMKRIAKSHTSDYILIETKIILYILIKVFKLRCY